VIAPTLAKIHHDSIEKNRQLKMETLILLNQTSLNEQAKEHKNQWILTISDNADRNTVGMEVKKFIDALEQDHLIGKNTFSVAVQNKELYIDGVKQSPETDNKYSKNIEATGDFISKEPNK